MAEQIASVSGLRCPITRSSLELIKCRRLGATTPNRKNKEGAGEGRGSCAHEGLRRYRSNPAANRRTQLKQLRAVQSLLRQTERLECEPAWRRDLPGEGVRRACRARRFHRGA